MRGLPARWTPWWAFKAARPTTSWIEVIPRRWAIRAMTGRPRSIAASPPSNRRWNSANASSVRMPVGRPDASTSKPRTPTRSAARSRAVEFSEPMWQSIRRATTAWSVETRSRSSRSRNRRSGHFASSQSIPTTHPPRGLEAAAFRSRARASSRSRVPSSRVHPRSPAESAMWAWASTKPGTTTAPRRSTSRVRRPRHRSACAELPTASNRSPRTARPFAHGRSRDAVKTLPSTKTTSASPAISGHVPQIREPGDRLAERLVSLREHEPHVPPALNGIAVERGPGDDRDPQPLDKVHRERPVVVEREAIELRHHVVCASGRPAVEAGVAQAPDEDVPFRLIRAGQFGVVRFRKAQGGDGGDLKRMGRADGQEVVGPAHRIRERLRRDRPADSPSGRAVRLGEAVDRDRPLRHVADRRERHVARAVEDDVLVDLVRHRDDVVIGAQVRDRPELVAGEHLARRVVRRVHDEDLRAVRERGLQRFLVDGPIGPRHAHVPRTGAADDRIRPVVLVERLEDHGLVALVDEREHRGHHRLGRTARDHKIGLRVRVDPVEGLGASRDRVAQLAGAPCDRVLVVSAVEGALRRFRQFLRRLEVWVALGQVHRAVQRRDRRPVGLGSRCPLGRPSSASGSMPPASEGRRVQKTCRATLKSAHPHPRGPRSPRMAERFFDFWRVDVFTDTPLTGNPLAVFPRATSLSTVEMVGVAREMNLSETTFVFPSTNPAAHYRNRIFTPGGEIPFAGHPSIGTAFVAAMEGLVPHPDGSSVVYQELEIGVLPLELICEGGQVKKVIMTQGEPTLGAEIKNAAPLAAALGVRAKDFGPKGLVPQVTATGAPSLQVPLRSIDLVKGLDPDLRALGKVPSKFGEKVVCYTFALGGETPGAAVHARGFAPDLGLEDPATGSAAGACGAYLASRGKLPSPTFVIEQGIEVRHASRIEVSVETEDGKPKVVRVGGQSVPIIRGNLRLP